MARGTDCAIHSHRTPVPQERHHLQPVSRRGETTDDNLALVCANAHGNIHYLLDAIEKAAVGLMARVKEGDKRPTYTDAFLAVPQAVVNTYSDGERKLARAGWRRYGADFMKGKLAREWTETTTMGILRTELDD